MDFHQRYVFNPKTDLLGRGGFSKVYKANDVLLEREVALKFFTADVSEKYQILNEIKKVIRFEHPNLCKYFDVAVLETRNIMGEQERVEVGIMEYLDSGDFRTFTAKQPEYIDKLFVDILQGLGYLHKKGIVHRDLKPQNILIKSTDEEPVAKITDFGISKLIDANDSNSSTLMGTVEYMAPEQFNPKRYGVGGKITTNLDLWSFGLLVYETFENKPLFGSRNSGISAEQVMSNILSDASLSKAEVLPEKYREIVKRCLVKDAAKRVQKAEELIHLFSGSPAVVIPAVRAVSDNTQTAVAAASGEPGFEATQVITLPERDVASGNPRNTEHATSEEVKHTTGEEVKHTISEEVKHNGAAGVRTGKKKGRVLPLLGVIGLLALLFFLGRNFFRNSPAPSGGTKAQTGSPINYIPEMVLVAGGVFRMGGLDADAADSEKPVHKVALHPFNIGRYEVTVAQFRQFVDSSKYKTTAELEGNSTIFKNGQWVVEDNINWRHDVMGNPVSSDSMPVVHISWEDATRYCEWLGLKTNRKFRLPTEAEWEYAAKGGANAKNVRFSGSDNIDEVAWYEANAALKLHPVGGKLPNALNLYDMSGNAMEWCFDWYDEKYHPAGEVTNNPRGASRGKLKVVRGGSWFYGDLYSRTANRIAFPLRTRGGNIGFRIGEELK